MKKIVGVLMCAAIVALGLTRPAFAVEQVITFDEPAVTPADTKGYNAEPPVPGKKYLTTEYAGDFGVRFVPVLPKTQDGTVYLGGTWGITGSAGPQFLGADGYYVGYTGQKYAGVVIRFDEDVLGFSIDFTVGEGTGVPPEGSKITYIVSAHDGDGLLYNLTGSATFPAVGVWKTITVGDPDPLNPILFDEVQFRVYLGEVAPAVDGAIAAAPESIGGGEEYVDAFLGFDNLRIISPPIAAFTGTPLEGCPGLEVCFTNLSVGADGWEWDFGDGGASTEENPCHVYAAPGTYTVSLTARQEGSELSDTETKIDYVTILPCEFDPNAEFVARPRSGCVPLNVSFTDLSENAVSWSWDFGDGATSTEQNPSHMYESPGSYTVSLTVSNGSSTATATKANYISATACNPPIADFYAIPTSGLKPLIVLFTNTSVGGTSFAWDFGDGGTSTVKHPSHIYTEVGVYTVSLTATNAYGSDTRTRVLYIIVYEGCIPPVADFSVSYPAPLVAEFTDLSQHAASWTWDFGDGSVSTEQNPVHVYAEDGKYTVSLTVSNQCGADRKVLKDYVIIIPPFTNLLYFPYVVSGDGWETEIGIVNTSDYHIVGGRLKGYTAMGVEETPYLAVALPVHARKLVTVGSAPFKNPGSIRYVVLEAASVDVEGYARIYKNGIYRASIPAVRKVSRGTLSIPHVVSNAAGWSTKLVFLNTDSFERDVTIDFDDQLDISRKAEITIPADGQYETTLESYFGGFKQPTIVSGVVPDGAGIIGVALYERGEEMDAVILTDKQKDVMYFPHVMCRWWWATGVVMYNPSDSAIAMTIQPFDSLGDPMPATTVDLPSRGKFTGTWCRLGLPAGAQWCMIEADDDALTGLEAFFRRDGEQMVAYHGMEITPEKRGVFPLLEKDGWTGIILANTEAGPATVVLTAYDDSGTALAHGVVVVNPHAKIAQLAQNFFVEDISAATYIGYTSDREIVGIQGNAASDLTMFDGLPSL